MKKERKRVVLRVLAAVLCLSLCLLSGCRSAKLSSVSGKESSDESTAVDYSAYEGEWKTPSGDVTLKVEKTHENSIMFSISKAVSGQKDATLQSAVAKIEDDIAAFEFSDDGYGNSGKGKLIFGKESIVCSITVDREDGDQWYVQSIAMDSEKLQKAGSANQNGESQQPVESAQEAKTESPAQTEQTPQSTETSIDLRAKNYLGMSPYDVTGDFGEILKTEYFQETIDSFGGVNYTYKKGIVAATIENPTLGNIHSLEVDYNKVSKTAFNYGGVDGKSNYNDVIRLLGTPNDKQEEPQYLYVNYIQGSFVTDIQIDASTGKVTKIVQYSTAF